MPLDPQQRARSDPSGDAQFYAFPRFVTHLDDAFLARVEGHGMNAEVSVRPGAEPRFPWLGGGTDPFYSVLARRAAAEESG